MDVNGIPTDGKAKKTLGGAAGSTPRPAANLKSNSGEGASTMGDKGGKKGKDKSHKQNDKKQKQKDKDKVDKQPKSKLLP